MGRKNYTKVQVLVQGFFPGRLFSPRWLDRFFCVANSFRALFRIDRLSYRGYN